MNALMITMRLVHITLGVFWAGTMVFVALFLEPSVRAAGPDGAKVMQGLVRRHYLNIMPAVAILTILSGLVMFWRLSAGHPLEWMHSTYGMALTTGGVAAILAAVLGIFVMRASVIRAGKLMAQAQQASDAEREVTMATVQTLRLRARTAGRWVAGLLIVAVVTMAVGRYI